MRRGGRAVEGARLEIVYAGNRIGGSNPPLSAIFIYMLIKKSFTLFGHATSIKLEESFWEALEDVAKANNQTLKEFIEFQDSHRKNKNLASHLRTIILEYYKSRNLNI